MQICFRIEYKTEWGESLSLFVGGNRYPMTWNDGGIWTVTVKRCSAAALKDYTYVVMRDGLIHRTEWKHHSSEPAETITDRWIDCPIEGCPFPREHQAAIFDRPGFRGAGIAVPVFSLRTESDFGIGEFRDLRPLVDWAAATGQCIIQLLPVNDTTRNGSWKDSYPYSPVSSFALHPLYIHLQDLGIKEDEEFLAEQKKLNGFKAVDYPKVFKAKMKYIRRAWLENGEKDLRSRAFRTFFKNNAYWLEEYAGFSAERDGLEPEYYWWMQFHLDRQFAEEAAYARAKGVFFKGDLPIGVSADSDDAHWHPELFNLDSTAGAPPDYFSAHGQNWGFPTYNWDEMAKDNYAWWKSRLRKMAEYFDAFRIDHILGFFRIWEIPAEETSGQKGHFNPGLPYSAREIEAMGLPLEGLFHDDPRHPGMYQPLITPDMTGVELWQQERFWPVYNDFFFHRHEDMWRHNAMKKLPELLSATGMLACGEDLGMIPACVPEVMNHEKILSLMMRGMQDGSNWNPMSVCATSSHDMDTLRMQCHDDPDAGSVKRMLDEFLHSPSMLAIFPLQDWVALDMKLRRKDRKAERINQPADPNHHWCFRIHFDLNRLLKEEALTALVRDMVRSSARASR